MRQILEAVNALHELNICHRDLKLENFLFETEGDDSLLKLIDFGYSRRFEMGQEVKLRALVGSPIYVAPEVIKGSYGLKCDVWSIGIVLHLLLCGIPPFNDNDNEELLHKILKF